MSPSFWYGCVPVVGGLILILGGTLALWVDRKDVLAAAEGTSKQQEYVLIRYISQATFDLRKRPHWIFLCTTVLVAPFLTVTAVWQSQLALHDLDSNKSDNLARDLKLFAYLAAASLVLVAASPMGNAIGTMLHTVFAGCVVAFGLNYCIRAQTLANDRGDETLSIIRQVSWILGAVGALVVLFTTYPAVLCTEKIQQHERAVRFRNALPEEMDNSVNNDQEGQNDGDNEGDNAPANNIAGDILTLKEIRLGRRVETTLAVGQVSQAIMIGVVLISAANEVGEVHDLDTNDSSNETLIVGLVSAATAVSIAAFFAVFNTRFFRLCQEHMFSNESVEVSQ